MRVYVAGKWEDREQVRELQNKLIKAGHEITKDWTADREGESGYPIINVVEDVYGIRIADIYVGQFINSHNYKGALVEMGVALRTRIPVYIIGHAIDSCIFSNHPLVKKFETEEDLIKELNDNSQ